MIVFWWIVAILLIVGGVAWFVATMKDDYAICGGCFSIIFSLAIVLIGIIIIIVVSVDTYTPTEEEIAQAQENYTEAYGNTVALENYTIDTEVSLKKGWLGLGITISGDISKSDGSYSGNVAFDMPGDKYNCSYSAPYGESGAWSKLYVDGVEGNNCMNIPFNIADFESGILCDLDAEIVSTGVPTDASLSNITFNLTNEQTQELYGAIFEFFKTMAGSDLDLSNLEFTSSVINVSLQDKMIKSFNVTLSGKANAGSIKCELKCTVR